MLIRDKNVLVIRLDKLSEEQSNEVIHKRHA